MASAQVDALQDGFAPYQCRAEMYMFTRLHVYTHANARNYTILIEFDSINHHLPGGVVSENSILEGNYQRKYSMSLHDPKNAMLSLIYYHLPKLLHLSIPMTQCHHSTGSLLI